MPDSGSDPELPSDVPSEASGDGEVALPALVGDDAQDAAEMISDAAAYQRYQQARLLDDFETSNGGAADDAGGSEVELPESCHSDDDAGDWHEPESEVELPRDTDKPCKCNHNCHRIVPPEMVMRIRTQLKSLSFTERQQAQYDKVRLQVVCPSTGVAKTGKIKWALKDNTEGCQEIKVCSPFWQHVHVMGAGRMSEIRKLVAAGHIHEPPRLPSIPPMSAKSQWNKADSWFLRLYRHLAEPLADTKSDQAQTQLPITDLNEFHVVDVDDHPLWMIGHVIADPDNPMRTQRMAPVRHLNPQKFEDIVFLHQVECGAEAVSESTLRRCWDQRWCHFIGIRNIGQGKRCRECAVCGELRASAITLEERTRVAERITTHIDGIMGERNHSTRGNHLAEHDSSIISSDGFGLMGKLTLDGMDQAKFRCPRNLASSAEFEPLWRPQLHVVGAIYHGVIEAYFVMPPDIAKDSNMNCTCVNRTLDLAQEELAKRRRCEVSEVVMPRSLVINADNTTREGKNQHFATHSLMQVGKKKFEAVANDFPSVGHTHNEQDQRFSTVATTLSSAPILEEPLEFVEWIREHVMPVRGRALVVEVLDSTMNFQKWQVPLNIMMSGLAATHHELHTNHSWKFCQRRILGDVDGHMVENQHPEWAELEAHPDDVIMCVKKRISSSQLTQRPLLVLPAGLADQLDAADLEVNSA